jgi:hypothetical protein
MLGLQHPASAMDMQMYALAHPRCWLEHAIRDLASSLARRYCAIDTLRKNDWLGKRCLAFPSKLAVLLCAHLRPSAGLHSVLLSRHTSYHLGPSAQILISFSLNSSVCLSASLRSNLDASMVRSDLSDMMRRAESQETAVRRAWGNKKKKLVYLARDVAMLYLSAAMVGAG